MPSFDARPFGEAMETMKEINVVITRSFFIALFLGNAAAAAILIGIGMYDMNAAGAWPMIAGGAAYLLGAFLVTIVFNVPRNKALAAMAPDEPIAAKALWNDYREEWTRWNSIRAGACIISTVLLAASLLYK